MTKSALQQKMLDIESEKVNVRGRSRSVETIEPGQEPGWGNSFRNVPQGVTLHLGRRQEGFSAVSHLHRGKHLMFGNTSEQERRLTQKSMVKMSFTSLYFCLLQ